MLPGYSYVSGRLLFDGQDVQQLADLHGTPLYVYSERLLAGAYRSYARGIGSRRARICFAMKANSSAGVLRLFASLGAGADIVSGGELYRALRAGIPADGIVYSGVGKTDDEIRYALRSNIMLFSVESAEELDRLAALAAIAGARPRVSLRINPDVDAKTHPYISTGLRENKFGIPFQDFLAMLERGLSLPSIELAGFGFHIGSQLTDISGFEEAAAKAKSLASVFLSKVGSLSYLDVGGGLGIRYGSEDPPDPEGYVHRMLSILDFPEATVLFEPGRSLVGSAGMLLSRIEYRKENGEKTFYICDAAMNDLIRPSLYEAHHEIYAAREERGTDLRPGDLVGPVCETGDFLARDRSLPHFEQKDIVAVATAGAYGMTMSSQYNSRPRAAEVMIRENGTVELLRRRETYEDLVAAEA